MSPHRVAHRILERAGTSALVGALVVGALVVGLVACTGGAPDAGTPSPGTSAPPSTSTGTSDPSPSPAPDPVSVLGVAAQTHTGDRLRLGTVREQTAAFTSYDVTYRVRSTGPGATGRALRVSGVLNVPRGDGPFPAVVLAHGYIDPSVYESGQGMTRERGFLAERGYVTLHVDYRGHAGSDPDPTGGADVRLGYAVDVIGAVGALRAADLPVDDERVGLFGRSMGGGVVQKVAAIAPGLTGAVVAWAAVSSLEAENVDQFIRDDPARVALLRASVGLPEDDPAFWRGVSTRPVLDRITEPVLSVHGRLDETCPPRWARATQRAMVAADVDAELAWYDDGHAFGPAF
ncbi:MAG: alpha/beta hydrolase family protein, partial [Nocardioides sp.]|uniref:alpha/beta hydrolase family protein n=1 Tax=Nocardioides sp. TaxID=35761 RepID=UPI003F0C7CF4